MTCADASACAALLWPALDAAGAAAAAEPSTGDAPITAAEIARALSHGALAARPAALGGPNSAPPPPPRLPASGSHKRRVSDHGAGSDSNGNRPAKVGIRGAPKKADSAAAGSTVAWQSAEFQPVVVARSAARSRQCEGEAAVAARRHAGRLVAFLEDTGVLTPGEATAARAANSEAAAALFQLAETAGGDCASGAIAGSSFAAVSGFAALAAVPPELHPLHHSQMQAAGFDLKFVARMVEGVCSPKLDAKYISRWRKDDKGAANRTAVCLLLKVALHLALRERVAERRAELCEHVGELLRRCDSGASAPPLATSPPAACSSNKSGGCASTDALCADGLTFAHALSTDLTAPPSSVALPIAGSAVAAANTAAMAAASAARSVAPNPSYRVDSSLPRSGSSTTAAAAAASARSALMPVPAATESAATAAVARGGFPASLAVSATVSLTHRYLCDFGACLSASERRLYDSVVAHTGAMREWMASRGLNFAAWMGIDLPASLRCHEFSSDPTLEGDQRRLLDGLVSDIRAAARAAAPNAGAAARLAAASDMPAALRKNRSMPWEQKVVRHVFAKSAVQLEASRPPLLGGKLADGVAMAGTLKRTLGLRELPASLSSAFAGYDALVSRAEGRRRFRLYLQSARRGAAQNGITMGCRSACCMAIDGENGSACVDYVLDAAYPFLVVEEITNGGPPAVVVHSNYFVALSHARDGTASPVLVCDNLESNPNFRVQTGAPSANLAAAHNACVDAVLSFVREWQAAVGLPADAELIIGRTLNSFKLTKCNPTTRELMPVKGAREVRLRVSVPAGCLRADTYLDSYGGKYIARMNLKQPTSLPFDLVPLPERPLPRDEGRRR